MTGAATGAADPWPEAAVQDHDSAEVLQRGLSNLAAEMARVDLDGDRMAADLARLVLGLVAFLHRVLELQAIRHLENGTLPLEDLDRIGVALSRADVAIGEMAVRFGLTRADLSLDLGPLGRTI